MTKIFNGRKFAIGMEKSLKKEVVTLKTSGIVPKLVSILVGDDGASKLFLKLKKRVAQRVGAALEIVNLENGTSVGELTGLIDKLNDEKDVHGIMVQLPLPSGFSKKDRARVLETIDPRKDVDGMREGSVFLTPTAKAVLKVLQSAGASNKVVVVGASGFEGRKIAEALRKRNYVVKGANSATKDLGKLTLSADVLVSVTGQKNLISGEMVKPGAVVIDFGSPKGDVVTSEVAKVAGFLSPVPGGIGPVTIMCLMENLVESCKEAISPDIIPITHT